MSKMARQGSRLYELSLKKKTSNQNNEVKKPQRNNPKEIKKTTTPNAVKSPRAIKSRNKPLTNYCSEIKEPVDKSTIQPISPRSTHNRFASVGHKKKVSYDASNEIQKPKAGKESSNKKQYSSSHLHRVSPSSSANFFQLPPKEVEKLNEPKNEDVIIGKEKVERIHQLINSMEENYKNLSDLLKSELFQGIDDIPPNLLED